MMYLGMELVNRHDRKGLEQLAAQLAEWAENAETEEAANASVLPAPDVTPQTENAPGGTPEAPRPGDPSSAPEAGRD